jgi:uncharacterized protein (TIGR02266 family)
MSASTDNPDRARSLHARLLALSTDDIAPPHVDPYIAALAALGLVDFARSPEGKARFAELTSLGAFDPAKIDDLDALANALLGIIEKFDAAPRQPKAILVPQALEVECRVRRGMLANLLSENLELHPAVAVALKHLKLSYGPIDLALDLRMLAAHVDAHADDLKNADGYNRDLVPSTRKLAQQLEDVLYSADTPKLQQARSALHRMWTLFERVYRDIAETGRELFHHDAEHIFPTLEAIAYISRTARHESSSSQPAAAIVEQKVPSSKRTPPMSRRPSSRRMPAVRPAGIDAKLLSLDVVLNHTSESNLYLGFSQDVAEGGVFVATYEVRPIGARVQLAIHLEGGDPVHLDGHVHWLRPQGSGDDMPVGVGVRLGEVSKDIARALESFAARRTPIFYDD